MIGSCIVAVRAPKQNPTPETGETEMTNRCCAMALALICILIIGLTPKSASAYGDSRDGERVVKLHTTERFSPIGAIVESSFTNPAVVINGRAGYGEQMIWGGELIQTPAGKSVNAVFDSIGRVTLTDGAMARFSAASGNSDDASKQVLIASLISGTLTIKLDADAGAYVEAAGSAFTASPKAHFRIDATEGRATLARLSGTVTVEQRSTQPRYILRPPAGQGSSLSVSARSTRQIQIQVTDENDRPVPDLPILFSLGDPCLGSIGLGAGAGTVFQGKTDRRGIAAVPWIAGAAACAGQILVKVEGTEMTYTYTAQVNKQTGFWNTRNTLLVSAAAVAAAVGIGIAVANSGDDAEPIRQVPPPQVNP